MCVRVCVCMASEVGVVSGERDSPRVSVCRRVLPVYWEDLCNGEST